ncbi:LPS-induced tumour necrosis factor alpha factor,Reverse transcriptase domain, partial [Cinara cedri]
MYFLVIMNPQDLKNEQNIPSAPPSYFESVSTQNHSYIPQQYNSQQPCPGYPQYAPQVPTQVIVIQAPALPPLGKQPVEVICPKCKAIVLTTVQEESSNTAYLCCLFLLVVGCTLFSCLPFCMDSFKNYKHTCSRCKGSKTDINNFKLVILLNGFSKIFEKAIKTRLINYLEENNLLANSQYGFRKGLDTEDALANQTKDISAKPSKFDSISHITLLDSLNSFGITGSAFIIYKSYLEERTQQIRINNTLRYETVKILNSIFDQIVNLLVHIFNLKIKTSIFLLVFYYNFKLAFIKPLYKRVDCKHMGNYRPIFILTHFSKNHYVKNHFVSRKKRTIIIIILLSKNQYGFKLSLDLAMAFGSIHRDILFKILLIFGINNRNLLWFKSYLSCRKPIVKLNDITSDENFIKYGVPHGSVLGPVLFILYINV